MKTVELHSFISHTPRPTPPSARASGVFSGNWNPHNIAPDLRSKETIDVGEGLSTPLSLVLPPRPAVFVPPPRGTPWSTARSLCCRIAPTPTSPCCSMFLRLACSLVHRQCKLVRAPDHCWAGCEHIVVHRLLDIGDVSPERLRALLRMARLQLFRPVPFHCIISSYCRALPLFNKCLRDLSSSSHRARMELKPFLYALYACFLSLFLRPCMRHLSVAPGSVCLMFR